VYLIDPPPSPADLHFRLFGFPIRITPWFWIGAVLLGLGDDSSPERVLAWVPVVLVSVLVHELGHAFAFRYFHGNPRITLIHFGGLAIDERLDRSPGQQILISAAGPAAGFMLAGVVVAVLAASGNFTGFRFGLVPVAYDTFDPVSIHPETSRAEYSMRDLIVWDLLFVNFVWGLMNLLPVYPLDGGQISREIFVELDAGRGIVRSLWLSIVVAAVVAVYALFAWNSIFVPIMFGLLAFGSYQMLQAYMGRGSGMGW
jgi:Zn-dependent protease